MVDSKIILKECTNLYFICFIICISFCNNNYQSFILNTEIKSQLEIMNIIDINKGICEKLVPSLFSPIILFPSSIRIKAIEVLIDLSEIFIPVLSNYEFLIRFYNLSSDSLLGYILLLWEKKYLTKQLVIVMLDYLMEMLILLF